jgi:hypothetical protein
MSSSTTVRRQIGPLDLADELLPMAFGYARIAKFLAEELEKLFECAGPERKLPDSRWRLSVLRSSENSRGSAGNSSPSGGTQGSGTDTEWSRANGRFSDHRLGPSYDVTQAHNIVRNGLKRV